MRSIQLPALFALAATLIACDELGQDFEVHSEINERVTTIIDVSWTTDEPGVSWVEFGRDGRYDMMTPLSMDAGTEHSFQLVGVPAETELSYRAVTETSEGQLVSEGSITTGALPEVLPHFRVDTWDESQTIGSDWMLTGYELEDSSWMLAVDRRGGVVWYEQIPENATPFSVELDQDAPGVLYNARQRRTEGESMLLVQTTVNEGTEEPTVLPMGHHAMTQLPLGGVAWISADIRPWQDPVMGEVMDVQGDAVNILGPNGEHFELFNAWDWSTPRINEYFGNEYFEDAKDWTHANALSLHPERDTLLLSLRNLAILLELDMRSGNVIRVLGGEVPGAFTEGSAHFEYQHDPNWTPDGTILMVSSEHSDDGSRTETVAREYRIDEEASALDEIWSYGEGMGIHASHHGGARVLPNGNRLVNFGAAGVVHEVTVEGETVWSVASVPAISLGASVLVDDLYDLVR